jgi:hypothetical protein
MNKYSKKVKSNLLHLLNELDSCSWLFTRNPEKDFSRKRKLDFKEMIRIILSMGGKSLNFELLEYFSYETDMVTKSAFVQQRDKILPEAFETLFHSFNNTLKEKKLHGGYRLLAVDGTDLCIPFNSNDQDTHFPNGPKAKGFNLLHVNVMYDLCSRTYVDALIQPGRKAAERQALIKMVERSKIKEKVIIIGDRGYENYNACEHIIQKGWDYIIRIKDVASNGIASGLSLPKEDVFDIECKFEMTRSQTKATKNNKQKYKFLPANQVFDYLPAKSKNTYPFRFRVLRFPITDNAYEVIITSLSKETFPAEKIKELYCMRWGIETSFRELKYAIGLTNFHSKKVPYILQEIFAKLIMYNFCEAITTHVIVQQANRKHTYQVNFTVAIAICLHYFRCRKNIRPPNVEALIQKNILPVRPNRKDPRKVKTRSAVSFLYRVA